MSEPIQLSVQLNGTSVSALAYGAGGYARGTLVLAHGAGAGHRHPFVVHFARALSERGFDVVTFNFPYMEQRRRVPDPQGTLEACYVAVVRHVQQGAPVARPLIVGGKSLGGRIASHVAAVETTIADGLVFLGYPLHPPRKPERLRTAHLDRIRIPMLFVQGSRDTFGTPDELRPVLHSLGPRASACIVPNGDHSFAIPKGSQVTQTVCL